MYLNADERMREIARNREDAWLTEMLSLAEATKKGLAEGKTIGIAEGEQKKAREVAKALIAKKIAFDIISSVTGLSQSELLSL